MLPISFKPSGWKLSHLFKKEARTLKMGEVHAGKKKTRVCRRETTSHQCNYRHQVREWPLSASCAIAPGSPHRRRRRITEIRKLHGLKTKQSKPSLLGAKKLTSVPERAEGYEKPYTPPLPKTYKRSLSNSVRTRTGVRPSGDLWGGLFFQTKALEGRQRSRGGITDYAMNERTL